MQRRRIHPEDFCSAGLVPAALLDDPGDVLFFQLVERLDPVWREREPRTFACTRGGRDALLDAVLDTPDDQDCARRIACEIATI